jgi:predicted small metal-binding protein
MVYKADLKQVCGCGITVEGETTDDLVSKVKDHAAHTHNIKQVPPDLAEKLMKAIKQD